MPSRSGVAAPVSQLEMVLCEHPSRSAISFWVSFRSARLRFMYAPKTVVGIGSLPRALPLSRIV